MATDDRLERLKSGDISGTRLGDWQNVNSAAGRGNFEQGIARGKDNLDAMLYASVDWLGDIVGSEALSEWAQEGVENNLNKAMLAPASIQKFEDIDSYAQLGTFALESIAEFIPQAATMLGSGGAGVMARAAFGKTLASQLSKSALKRASSAGAMAGSSPQLLGETQLSFNDSDIKDPAAVLATSLGKLGLEYLPVNKLSDIVLKPAGKLRGAANLPKTPKSVTLQAVKDFNSMGLAEGLTEGAQSLLDDTAISALTGEELVESEVFSKFWNSATRAYFGGGSLGGLSGIPRTLKQNKAIKENLKNKTDATDTSFAEEPVFEYSDEENIAEPGVADSTEAVDTPLQPEPTPTSGFEQPDPYLAGNQRNAEPNLVLTPEQLEGETGFREPDPYLAGNQQHNAEPNLVLTPEQLEGKTGFTQPDEYLATNQKPLPVTEEENSVSVKATKAGKQKAFYRSPEEQLPLELQQAVYSGEMVEVGIDTIPGVQDESARGGSLVTTPDKVDEVKQLASERGLGAVQNYGVDNKPENPTHMVIPVDESGAQGSPVLVEGPEQLVSAQNAARERTGQEPVVHEWTEQTAEEVIAKRRKLGPSAKERSRKTAQEVLSQRVNKDGTPKTIETQQEPEFIGPDLLFIDGGNRVNYRSASKDAKKTKPFNKQQVDNVVPLLASAHPSKIFEPVELDDGTYRISVSEKSDDVASDGEAINPERKYLGMNILNANRELSNSENKRGLLHDANGNVDAKAAQDAMFSLEDSKFEEKMSQGFPDAKTANAAIAELGRLPEFNLTEFEIVGNEDTGYFIEVIEPSAATRGEQIVSSKRTADEAKGYKKEDSETDSDIDYEADEDVTDSERLEAQSEGLTAADYAAGSLPLRKAIKRAWQTARGTIPAAKVEYDNEGQVIVTNRKGEPISGLFVYTNKRGGVSHVNLNQLLSMLLDANRDSYNEQVSLRQRMLDTFPYVYELLVEDSANPDIVRQQLMGATEITKDAKGNAKFLNKNSAVIYKTPDRDYTYADLVNNKFAVDITGEVKRSAVSQAFEWLSWLKGQIPMGQFAPALDTTKETIEQMYKRLHKAAQDSPAQAAIVAERLAPLVKAGRLSRLDLATEGRRRMLLDMIDNPTDAYSPVEDVYLSYVENTEGPALPMELWAAQLSPKQLLQMERDGVFEYFSSNTNPENFFQQYFDDLAAAREAKDEAKKRMIDEANENQSDIGVGSKAPGNKRTPNTLEVGFKQLKQIFGGKSDKTIATPSITQEEKAIMGKVRKVLGSGSNFYVMTSSAKDMAELRGAFAKILGVPANRVHKDYRFRLLLEAQESINKGAYAAYVPMGDFGVVMLRPFASAKPNQQARFNRAMALGHEIGHYVYARTMASVSQAESRALRLEAMKELRKQDLSQAEFEEWFADKLSAFIVDETGTVAPSAEVGPAKTKNEEMADTKITDFDSIPEYEAGQNTMVYAGIGSRNTPPEILETMKSIAEYLAGKGYTLNSGGAKGADSAFEAGAGNSKQIFYAKDAVEVTRNIAREIHPNGKNLKQYALDLMARNTNQVFGRDLKSPVDFVLTWTRDGATTSSERSIKTGGTGQAIDMASRKGVPVFNLAKEGELERFKQFIENKSKRADTGGLAEKTYPVFERVVARLRELFDALTDGLNERFRTNARFNRFMRTVIAQNKFRAPHYFGYDTHKNMTGQGAGFASDANKLVRKMKVQAHRLKRRNGKFKFFETINTYGGFTDTEFRNLVGDEFANQIKTRSQSNDASVQVLHRPIKRVWNSKNSYGKGDIVYHNGNFFKAERAIPAGSKAPSFEKTKGPRAWTYVKREKLGEERSAKQGYLDAKEHWGARWTHVFSSLLPKDPKTWDAWLVDNVVNPKTIHPEFKKQMDEFWAYLNSRMGGRLGNTPGYRLPRVFKMDTLMSAEGKAEFTDLIRKYLKDKNGNPLTQAQADKYIEAFYKHVVENDGMDADHTFAVSNIQTVGLAQKYSRMLRDIPDSELEQFMEAPSARLFKYIKQGTKRAELESRMGGYRAIDVLFNKLMNDRAEGRHVDPEFFATVQDLKKKYEKKKADWEESLAGAKDAVKAAEKELANAKAGDKGRIKNKIKILENVVSKLLDNKPEAPKFWDPMGRFEEVMESVDKPEDRRRLRKAMDAILGRSGLDMNPTARKFQQYLVSLQYYTTLLFAVPASISDFGNILVRTKDFSSFAKNVKNMLKNISQYHTLAEQARIMGLAQHDAIVSIIQSQYGEMYMDPKVQKWNETFFRFTGLEQFTRMTRVVAMGMGKDFIREHARKAGNGDKRSERYLRELGLEAADVALWESLGEPVSMSAKDPNSRTIVKVLDALDQFVTESVLRPDAGQRPVWANDMRFQLVWQLKSFFWAFAHNIMGGIYREMRSRAIETGNPLEIAAPTVLASISLLPLAALGLSLRETIKYGFEEDPTDDEDMISYTYELFDRAGGLGPLNLVQGMFDATERGNSGVISLLGPTAGHAETFLSDGFAAGVKRGIPVHNQLNGSIFGINYDFWKE